VPHPIWAQASRESRMLRAAGSMVLAEVHRSRGAKAAPENARFADPRRHAHRTATSWKLTAFWLPLAGSQIRKSGAVICSVSAALRRHTGWAARTAAASMLQALQVRDGSVDIIPFLP